MPCLRSPQLTSSSFSRLGVDGRPAWRQSLRAPLLGFPAHLSALHAPAPPPLFPPPDWQRRTLPPPRETIDEQLETETWLLFRCLLFLFFFSFFFFCKWDSAALSEEFHVRNVEGYGSNDGCVADSWSKVRHLSVSSLFSFLFFTYQILSTLVGGKNPSKWEDTWRTETRRVERKMWIKRSVARR